MNKKSIKGLIYSDFCLTKKGVISNLTLSGIFVALCFLVWLSIKYGNLKLMLDSFVEEDQESLLHNLSMASKFIPILFLCSLSTVCAEICAKEVKPKWNCYRMSLSVTPWRYAMGKYTYMLILNLGGGALATAYMVLYSVATEGQLVITDYIYLLLIMCGMATFVIFFMDITLLVRSMDIAGFVFFLLIMGGCLVLSANSEEVNRVEQIRDALTHFSSENLWVLVVYYMLIHILGYLVAVRLYTRREK